MTDSSRTKQLDEVRDVSLNLWPVGIINDNDCRSYWNLFVRFQMPERLYLRTATSQPLVARLQSCKSFDFPMPPRPLSTNTYRSGFAKNAFRAATSSVRPTSVVDRSRMGLANCGAF